MMQRISGTKLVVAMLVSAAALAIGAALMILSGRAAIEGITKGSSRLPQRIETPQGAMVLVGGGRFLMGPEKSPVTLRAFYIDRTEVTQQAYGSLRAKPSQSGTNPGLPIAFVSWIDAKTFCEAVGKRLPLPIEWEKAARGEFGTMFPWGDAADSTKANVAGNASAPRAPMAADSLPAGASPYGALHMAGNLWEWVDDPRQPGLYTVNSYAAKLTPPPTASERWYTIKGGAFDRPLSEAISQEFVIAPARYAAADIGFRCAKDP